MHRFWVEMWDWKTFAAAIATILVVVSCWFAVSDELKDRATAAAYTQTVKDQRVERAKTSEEIARLRNRIDVLIRSIQESGGTIPPEAFNSSSTIRRGTTNNSDDDDDDGDSITVNNPPREDENPTPKAPVPPPSATPPDTVEDLTKKVEDTVDDLSKNPLMGGTPK